MRAQVPHVDAQQEEVVLQVLEDLERRVRQRVRPIPRQVDPADALGDDLLVDHSDDDERHRGQDDHEGHVREDETAPAEPRTEPSPVVEEVQRHEPHAHHGQHQRRRVHLRPDHVDGQEADEREDPEGQEEAHKTAKRVVLVRLAAGRRSRLRRGVLGPVRSLALHHV
jgi:hypothetical protein